MMQGLQGIANTIDERAAPDEVPCVQIEDGRYLVRFARSFEEIESALKLRFEVFNLELGEGLASSFQTGRDRDEFDATSHHLIATEKATGKTVGTYRLRTIEMAVSAAGFLFVAVILLQTLFFKFTGAKESVYIFTTLGAEPLGSHRLGNRRTDCFDAVACAPHRGVWRDSRAGHDLRRHLLAPDKAGNKDPGG